VLRRENKKINICTFFGIKKNCEAYQFEPCLPAGRHIEKISI